jgi:hypothetical protein
MQKRHSYVLRRFLLPKDAVPFQKIQKQAYRMRRPAFGVLSVLSLHFSQALLTHALTLEKSDVTGIIAKNTAGLIFLEDDLVPFGEDLKGILDLDSHGFPQLNRDNHAAKIVQFPYYTCGFHLCCLLFI